jgi:hypothetical protein
MMSTKERHQELGERALTALKRSGKAAIDRGRRTGTAVWAWRDGEWVNVLADYKSVTEKSNDESLTNVREEPAED